jgi:hypothetical protein
METEILEEFEVDYPVKWNRDTKKWETEKKKIVIKLMNYGDKIALTDSYMKMEVVGKNVTPRMSYRDMVEQTMLKALKSAPFPITLEGIRSIPSASTGNEIFNKIKDLNELTEEEKKNSDGE